MLGIKASLIRFTLTACHCLSTELLCFNTGCCAQVILMCTDWCALPDHDRFICTANPDVQFVGCSQIDVYWLMCIWSSTNFSTYARALFAFHWYLCALNSWCPLIDVHGLIRTKKKEHCPYVHLYFCRLWCNNDCVGTFSYDTVWSALTVVY